MISRWVPARMRLSAAFKNLSLLLVSTVVTLAVVEGVVRAVYQPVQVEVDAINTHPSGHYQRDDELWWTPRPNAAGIHVRAGSFSSSFTTNSRGLRDREYDEAKPDGVVRIVAVGDSFTWGYGVNDDEIFTEILESILPNTEVINLGVTGYNLKQEIRYFAREGARFDPDILLVAVAQNDILLGTGSPPKLPGMTIPTQVDEPPRGGFNRLKTFLNDHVVLYSFVADRLNTNKDVVRLLVKIGIKDRLLRFEETDTNLVPALREYPATLDSAMRRLQSELLDLKALSERHGMRLVVALIPALQTVDPKALQHSIAYTIYEESDFDLAKPYRLITEFASSNDIELINPVPDFRSAFARGESIYFHRDMHFNFTGHRLFAESIAAYLMKTGGFGS